MIEKLLDEPYWSDLEKSVDQMTGSAVFYIFKDSSDPNILSRNDLIELFKYGPRKVKLHDGMIKLTKKDLVRIIKNSIEEINDFVKHDVFFGIELTPYASSEVEQLAYDVGVEISNLLNNSSDMRIAYEVHQIRLTNQQITFMSQIHDIRGRALAIINESELP